jgi:hypothetical protein
MEVWFPFYGNKGSWKSGSLRPNRRVLHVPYLSPLSLRIGQKSSATNLAMRSKIELTQVLAISRLLVGPVAGWTDSHSVIPYESACWNAKFPWRP